MPQTSPLVRREPSFNLEDELLREFEQYEEPRAEPVAPVAPEPLRAREPVLRDSPVEADPFADSEPEDSMSASNWQVDREQPLAVDDPHVMPPAPVSVTGGKSDPDFGGLDDDLIAELETSLTAPAGSPMAGRTSPRGAYEPGFRMPLTNFVVAPPRTQSDSHDLSAGAGPRLSLHAMPCRPRGRRTLQPMSRRFVRGPFRHRRSHRLSPSIRFLSLRRQSMFCLCRTNWRRCSSGPRSASKRPASSPSCRRRLLLP